MSTTTTRDWRPLTLLEQQFRANVAALAKRSPELARFVSDHPPREYVLAIGADSIALGRKRGDVVEPIANPVTPAAAHSASRVSSCASAARSTSARLSRLQTPRRSRLAVTIARSFPSSALGWT